MLEAKSKQPLLAPVMVLASWRECKVNLGHCAIPYFIFSALQHEHTPSKPVLYALANDRTMACSSRFCTWLLIFTNLVREMANKTNKFFWPANWLGNMLKQDVANAYAIQCYTALACAYCTMSSLCLQVCNESH